jgi:Putative lumazine-binding
MRRFALALLFFATLAVAYAATPWELNCAPDESSVVRATATDYIDGYYAGDAARMEKSLHPH